MAGDIVTTEGDPQDGRPLLKLVMREGRRLAPAPSLIAIRAYAAEEVKCLPEDLRGLEKAPPYEVRISESLRALAAEVDRFIDRARERP